VTWFKLEIKWLAKLHKALANQRNNQLVQEPLILMAKKEALIIGVLELPPSSRLYTTLEVAASWMLTHGS
jgi:hypothetical protein